MTITLELTPEEEAHVRRGAQLRGEDLPTYVKNAALRVPLEEPAPGAFDAKSAREKRAYLARMGAEAADEARASLHAKAAPVYSLEGDILVQEMPDGTTRQVRSLRTVG